MWKDTLILAQAAIGFIGHAARRVQCIGEGETAKAARTWMPVGGELRPENDMTGPSESTAAEPVSSPATHTRTAQMKMRATQTEPE